MNRKRNGKRKRERKRKKRGEKGRRAGEAEKGKEEEQKAKRKKVEKRHHSLRIYHTGSTCIDMGEPWRGWGGVGGRMKGRTFHFEVKG